MATYINTSLDPCDDFFSYVCSNAIRYALSEDTIQEEQLQRAMVTGVMPNNVPMLQAGHFLNTYYKTCVQTILNRHSFANGTVNALLRKEADLLKKIDSRKAMVFLMVSAFKYSLRSCIAIFGVCAESVFKMEELWSLFQVEVLTSNDKDIVAKQVFASVRDVMHRQLRTSTLIEVEDFDNVASFFKNVTLRTPMSETYASIPVPNATLDFAENLLRGRAYDVTISIARWTSMVATAISSHRGVLVINYRHIILSPFWYNFIFPTSANIQLLNMAVLGQLMAEILWVLALYAVPWEQTTASNLRNLTTCFTDVYLQNFDDASESSSVLFMALSFSTLAKSLNSPEWHTVKPAWSLWSFSHAQFFYIFSNYYRCPKVSSPKDKFFMNIPLMYVEDFATAFKCSSNTPMKTPRRCVKLDGGEYGT
ncbi:hypothetical protein HPB49_000755 [Dermacentor silvarum]|uniref:Uncharacterized protein n=1 Tax=Dermacentor silvarum TaxID=543639 RepID=A0ACB8CJ10_DERSI|nr:hypothetical protein HPB49_000755 [Dermacentor silvarum]